MDCGKTSLLPMSARPKNVALNFLTGIVRLIHNNTFAERRGAAGRCSSAVRGVPGSNPGLGMDVTYVCAVLVSLSSMFAVTAVWNRHGLWKKVSLTNEF